MFTLKILGEELLEARQRRGRLWRPQSSKSLALTP